MNKSEYKNSERQKEREASVVTWINNEEPGHLTCVFQIQAVTPQELTILADKIGGTRTGTGYDPSTKESIWLIEKTFKSKQLFSTFVDGFNYKVNIVK